MTAMSTVPAHARPASGVAGETLLPLRHVEENVAKAIRGKPEAIRMALATLLARGHLLIEDVPGVGKTTLARALAKSLGGTFRRIQFTSDLLPSIETCRSSIASSRALCVFGGARLISSASTIEWKIGPE